VRRVCTMKRRDMLSLLGLATCSGCANMRQLAGLIPEIEPQPLPPVPDPPGDLDWVIRSSLLSDDASRPWGRKAGVLSPVWDGDRFTENLAWHKRQGDNTLHLALADQGDNAAPVAMYKTGNVYVGGTSLDLDQINRMCRRMAQARQAGFKLVGWLTMDDSRAIHTAGTAALVRHANDCHRIFDKYLDAYCIGLEIDEDGRKSAGSSLVTALRSATDKNIWCHFTQGGMWRTGFKWGCSGIFWQYGFGKDKGTLVQDTKHAAAAIAREAPGFRLNAFEYSRFSNHAEGLGEALISAGASSGYGCG